MPRHRRCGRWSSRRRSAWPTCGLLTSTSADDGCGPSSAACSRRHHRQFAQTSLSLVSVRSILEAHCGSPGSSDPLKCATTWQEDELAVKWISSHYDRTTCNGSVDSTPASSTSKPQHSHCMCARFWSWTPPPCPAATPSTGCVTSWPCASRPCRSSARSSPTADSTPTTRYGSRTTSSTSTGTCIASGCRRPGGRQELAEICGHIASLPLDRSQAAVGDVGHREHRGHRRPRRRPARGDDEGAPRRGRRRDRRQPDVAAVQHRTRRAAPDPVEGVGGANELEIAISGAIKFATRPLKLVNVRARRLSPPSSTP